MYKGEKENRLGQTFGTTEGYIAEIIEYNGYGDCTIQLNDGTIIHKVAVNNLLKGTIKNPNHKTIHGVGYYGVGKYKSVGKDLKAYLVWRSMMQRCYDIKYHKIQPTYIECRVSEEWHNYQNFAAWFEDNYNPEYMGGWQLDKDFIIKNNKLYSPDTCYFIPQEINKLIIRGKALRGEYPLGVSKKKYSYQANCSINGKSRTIGRFKTPEEAFYAYKEVKENQISLIAEKYKDKLNNIVYEAIKNYRIEITD